MPYPVFEEPLGSEHEPRTYQSDWKRYRPGTSRRQWNAMPMWKYETGPLAGTWAPQCASCGYRDHRINMNTITGLPEIQKLLDEGRAEKVPLYCLACWLLETKPEQYTKSWADYDALTGKKTDVAKGTRVTEGTLARFPAVLK